MKLFYQIRTESKYHKLLPTEFLLRISYLTCLGGKSPRHRFRIEIHKKFSIFLEILQGNLLTALVEHGKSQCNFPILGQCHILNLACFNARLSYQLHV